jgi:hypothetical protein
LESNFAGFFNSHTEFYKKITEETFNNVQRKDTVEVLERYYGEKRNSYIISISPLLGAGNFGVQANRKKGLQEIYCIMGPYNEKEGIPLFGPADILNALSRHEFLRIAFLSVGPFQPIISRIARTA